MITQSFGRSVARTLVWLVVCWFAQIGTAAAYDLLSSNDAARSAPATLQGTTVSGNIYVFVSPETGISRVRFYLDDPTASGTPIKTEGLAPYDFAGTARNGSALPFDTTQLADGGHTITAVVELSAGGAQTASATFAVANNASSTPGLMLSTSPDRSGPVPLNGSTTGGNIYVFVGPETGISRVRFYLDNPTASSTPTKTENIAPYDFAGTAADGSALPFNTATLANGNHSVTALVDLAAGGSSLISAAFGVANGTTPTPALSFTPNNLTFTAQAGSMPAAQNTTVATSDGTTANYTITSNTAWLTATPATGSTTGSHSIAVDPSGLAPGTYTGTLTAAASGYTAATLQVTLQVQSTTGCSPVPCSQIKVALPYHLTFAEDHGMAGDANGIGTGFTYVQQPSNGTGYLPDRLAVDTAAGALRITTTSGIAFKAVNSQDNTLGVGIDAPNQVSVFSTTLTDIPAGSGHYEQAGLWFGVDEDNYDKLVVISTPTGTRIQHYQEVNGAPAGDKSSAVISVAGASVTLVLKVNPFTQTISSEYRIDGGAATAIASFSAPPEFFSFDAAGIDPTIGTRSFGGIFATHRNGLAPLTYTFDDFGVVAEATAIPGGGDFDFIRTSHTVPTPTSMVWGPDNRLYVTELLGKIHALTYNNNQQVTADQVITSLTTAMGSNRLTLGITVDPASTASNVILWVAHSDPSLNNGSVNSSMVSRLSGPGFGTVQHVITGLPRAIANHAINGVHFGPDGRLYIAVGGNTGAGAPNTANTEFGTRAEQPLSAAILVADVYNPNFDGTCANTTDMYGPPPCDVAPYATGLRNPYDFTFHSNGSLYATDNGLGVTGTFPPTPTPPCFGYGSTTSWLQGGDNPGEQPDLLHRIEQGMYYGHPNPSRSECVFKDGHYQGVAPLPNWQPPLLELGLHTSSDGIIEYTYNLKCGLTDELLIANYSLGDNVVRVRLSPDGRSVLSTSTLLGGFTNPLPLAMGPNGVFFVGELGANKVTAVKPLSLGCWSIMAPMPQAVLDAGGTALNGKLYVVGGKTATAHLTTLYSYNPLQNAWTSGPSMPGIGVENPAVAALNSKLYAFGGSTGPFSGAVATARMFDPAANAWQTLASMPTARGGATAQAVGGLIYVIGGMDGTGASLNVVEIYNPATNTWSTAAPMITRRDNPGSAALNGKVYVFGGRIRNADGTEVEPTLNTVEMYDPATNTWTPRAAMPTGRRTMAVGTLNGRAQVMGGERTPTGGVFTQNEEYDPLTDTWRTLSPMATGRHGAVAGTIDGEVYVVGGAPQGGTSFTTVNEAFHF